MMLLSAAARPLRAGAGDAATMFAHLRRRAFRIGGARCGGAGRRCRAARARAIAAALCAAGSGVVWFESEGSVCNAQNVVHGGNFDRHVRGHLRPQFFFRIRNGDDHRIGDDVLAHRRVEADLRNLSAEFLIRIRVDGEARELSDLHAADVGLIDVGLHLHLRQILRDRKKRRRLK